MKRLEFIDVMRGIAITLVVAGHLIQFNGMPKDNPVFEFIYSFHMPLFFAISGYITSKVTNINTFSEYVAFLKRKTLAIALPFLVWSFFVSNYVLRESWSTINMADVIQTLLHPGLWFLKTLFFILVAYGLYNYVLNKLKNHNELVKSGISLLISLSFIFVLVALCIEEKNIIMFFTAFMIGAMVALYPKLESVCKKDGIYALSAIGFFILVTHWNFYGGGGDRRFV